jgi:hypothetical protein
LQLQAEDVTSLTQQLQLLHVTKSFQQMFKTNGGKQVPPAASASSANSASSPAGNGGLGGVGNSTPAGSKELQSLENLFKVMIGPHSITHIPVYCQMCSASHNIAMKGDLQGVSASCQYQLWTRCLQVREALQAKAVDEKRRQLRHLEGQIQAKARESAAAAIHLKGVHPLLLCMQ